MGIGKVILGLSLAYVLLMGLGIQEFKTQYTQGKFQNSALWYKPIGKGFVVGKDSLVSMIDIVKGNPTESNFFFSAFKMVIYGFALLFISTMIFGILEFALQMRFAGFYSMGLTVLLILLIGIGSYGFEALIGVNEPVGMVVADMNQSVNGTVYGNMTNGTIDNNQPVVSLV